MPETASPLAAPSPRPAYAARAPHTAAASASPSPRKRIRRVDRSTLIRKDQRTREMLLLRRTREMLTAQLGGNPSPVERQLIDRAGMLSLYVAVADAKAIENDGEMSEAARKQYLAFSNSLIRTLKALGLKAAAAPPPSLADIAERIATRRSA